MKVTQVLLVLLGVVTGMAAYPAEPLFIPVTSPTQRLEFPGFSVLPPQGENWYIASGAVSEQLGPDVMVSFHNFSRPPSATHSVVALIKGGRVPLTESRPEYLRKIVQNNFVTTERHRVISVNVSPDSSLAPDCVRYDGTMEDRGVPRFAGSVFVIETRGFVCIHPEMADIAIEICYSQRRLQEETPLSLEADGEPFLKSLIFRKLALRRPTR